MTRLIRGILGFVLLFAAALPAADAQTLKHDFQRDGETYTVYLRIEEGWIETWRVGENGDCMMYPSVVEYEGDTIRFQKGTEWTVERAGASTMEITFPKGRTVAYERTQRDPATLCDMKGGRVD
ncbi:MAG: hypothetical protein ABEL51_07650 [Salinibacter sp.]